MKKLIITASIAFFVLVFASCKKNYTCTCNYLDNTGNYQTKVFDMNGRKNTVQVDCKNQEKALTYYGRMVSCEL